MYLEHHLKIAPCVLCYHAAHSCTGLALGDEGLGTSSVPDGGSDLHTPAGEQTGSVPDGGGDLHTPTGEQTGSVPDGGGDLQSPTEEPIEVDDAELPGL